MKDSLENNTLAVVISDPRLRVTTAEVTYYASDGKVLSAVGSSRCNGPDVYDEDLGEDLATARALKEIGRKIEKNARRIVAERDALRDAQDKASRESIALRKQRSEKIKLELGITPQAEVFRSIGKEKVS